MHVCAEEVAYMAAWFVGNQAAILSLIFKIAIASRRFGELIYAYKRV